MSCLASCKLCCCSARFSFSLSNCDAKTVILFRKLSNAVNGTVTLGCKGSDPELPVDPGSDEYESDANNEHMANTATIRFPFIRHTRIPINRSTLPLATVCAPPRQGS